MENFQSFGLPEALFNALSAMKYNTPTPIQAQTIPSAMQGLDVLGTAQTGTGKTAAYGIPLISHLINSTSRCALVLTPTRELAMQVLNLLEQMIGRKSNIKTALIIGGDSIGKQLNQLSFNPRLVVGTPGRINDHLARGTLKLNSTNFLVLDETDRMLDMGFGIQLEQIEQFLPHKRQTLMFSATLPNNIQKLAGKYLKDAIRVSIGSTIAAADTINQEIIRTSENDKHDTLLEQLNVHTGSCIIFVKTKMATEKLATKLRDHGHSADAIHGDLRQRTRERVIRGFRNRKHRILVATDVAARGLDIPHIECVVNYDLPQCEEDFIHRIGRTGRAGVKGNAVSLITPQDHQKWRNICKMMDPSAKIDPSFDSPKETNNRRRSGSRNNNTGGGFRNSERAPYPRRPGGQSYGAAPNEDSTIGNNNFRKSSEGRNRFDRPIRTDEAKKFGDQPARSENSRRFGDSPRPERDRRFGDQPARSENSRRFGDSPRPERDRKFGDQPARSENSRRFGDSPRPERDRKLSNSSRANTGFAKPSVRGKSTASFLNDRPKFKAY